MNRYDYVAKDLSGKNQKGFILAEDVSDFRLQLKQSNLFCLSFTEKDENDVSSAQSVSSSIKSIKLKKLVILCRQFATILGSGITVIKALEILYKQAENTNIKQVLLNVYEQVYMGLSLSVSMKNQGKAFPHLLTSMIEAGEAGGSLDSTMLLMADHFEKENQLRNKIKTALIYPIVLSLLSICVIVILLTFVIPEFVDMFSSMSIELPPITKITVSISNFVVNYWYIILAVVIALVIGIRMIFKIPSVRYFFQELVLSVPIFGKLTKIILTARFSRTLSSLYFSGVALVEALGIASGTFDNLYLSDMISQVESDVQLGNSLSDSLIRTNTFGNLFCSMVSIGEESGSLDNILYKTANYFDEEADAALQKMVAIIEPAMIIFLAIIIFFVIISVLTPVFSMYAGIA